MNTNSKKPRRVLDATCGSRMMWFDQENHEAIYVDSRCETHILCDGRSLNIAPDIQMDFRKLDFADDTFNLIVFDPPHLIYAGEKSWLKLKYGKLELDWRQDLKAGFAECFRVLKRDGVLIFKWNEGQIKSKEILALTQYRPLFGHPTGRKNLTHWFTFIK